MTVEQLESKVKVSGVNDYTDAMKKMAAASAIFAAQASSVGHSIRSVFSGIGRMLASPVSALSAMAIGGGVLALGVQAIKASADMEQLTATLEVLTGSAEIARQKLAFIRALDIPSTAGFKDLAESGVALEAYGLRLEKVLPLIAKLQAARPDKPIIEATSLFGRLASGDMPDQEAMAGFGLNKAQFQQQGVKFDSNGQLLSSAQDTMAALERIIDSKYGGILERMASTTTSRLASLESAWGKTLARIGDLIVPAIVPGLQTVTNFLNFIAESGALQTVLNGFLTLFNLGSGATALKKALSWLVAILQVIPAVLRGVGNVFSAVFKVLYDDARMVASIMIGMVSVRVIAGFIAVAKAIMQVVQALRAGAGVAATIEAMTGVGLPVVLAASAAGLAAYAGLGAMMGNIEDKIKGGLDIPDVGKLQQDVSTQFGNFEAKQFGTPGMPAMAQQGDFYSTEAGKRLGEISKATQGTERYTAVAAKALDFRKLALGGGDLGKMGVTAQEFGSFRAGRGRGGNQITININGGSPEKVREEILRMRRQGLL